MAYPKATRSICKAKGEEYSFNVLSRTQAMDCWSFSLPALFTCPGAVQGDCPSTGKPAVCKGCYARMGRQGMESVATNSAVRLLWVKRLLKTAKGRAKLADKLVAGIEATKSDYFRWFDSGDVFSYWMARVIENVILRTPNTKHWIPTRVYHLQAKRHQDTVAVLKRIAAMDNAVVRPSALYVDTAPPSVDGLSAGSSVPTSAETPHADRLCPKTALPAEYDENGRKITPTCTRADCRDCWDKPSQTVGYLVHGRLGRAVYTTDHEKSDALRKACCKAVGAL